MKKLSKKQRPADPNMRMASIMQDVIATSNKPIKAPKANRTKRFIAPVGEQYKGANQHNNTIDVVKIEGLLARRIELWRDGEEWSMHRLPWLVREALDAPGVKVWYELIEGAHRYERWIVYDHEHQTLTGNRLEAALR
jgi:hypothetical protein